MRTTRRPTRRGILLLCLILSVLANALLAGLGPLLASSNTREVVPQDKAPLAVELIDEPSEIKDNELPLVQNHQVEKERAPADAKRLSEFDSTVAKETRAANGRTLVEPAQAGRAAAKPGEEGQDSAKSPAHSPPATSARSAAPTGSDAQVKEAGELDPTVQAPSDGREQAQSEPSTVSPRALMPSTQQLRQSGTLAPSGAPGLAPRPQMVTPGTYDDLDDVEEGDLNLLNTKRFKYASFFNRVRDAIAQHWSPEPVHQRADPSGQVYGKKARVTILKIRLDATGKLVEAQVIDESGARHLDDEAVRSVRAAAPFANPPRELVDPTTQSIEFKFGFELTFSGSRIFRFRGR